MSGSGFGLLGLLVLAALGVSFLGAVIHAARKRSWGALFGVTTLSLLGLCFFGLLLARGTGGNMRATASRTSQTVEAVAATEDSSESIGQSSESDNTETRAPSAGKPWSVGEAVDRVSWSTLVSAAVLAGLLAIAYLFLDANTRGHYTWPLRAGTAIVFAAICIFLWRAGPLF